MDGTLQSPSTVAILVGLGLMVKGLVGVVFPGRRVPLGRRIGIRRHPTTPRRLHNDRLANSSFVGIGLGIACSSIVLPTALVGITTAVGLCSGLVTWFFLRMEALAVTRAGGSSSRA